MTIPRSQWGRREPGTAGGTARAIGERVGRRRYELGMTLRHLADASGLSVGFLSDVQGGHRSLSVESLLAIAVALDVDFAWLVDGRDRRQEGD